MKNIFILFVLASALLLMHCWQKQKHEITAPVVPTYTLTGQAKDLDTEEPLKDIIVSLETVNLIYDTEMISAKDTTDDQGQFGFEGISPGSYLLTGYRSSFPVVSEQMVMEHGDKVFNLALPKYLFASRSYSPPEFPHFKGICWKTANVLAGVTTIRRFSDDMPVNTIVQGTFRDGFKQFGSSRYTLSNPKFYALAYSGRYLTTDGNSPRTTIYSIDNAKGNIEGKTVTAFTIHDLTSDGQNIWASTDLRKIVKFGNHPSVIIEKVDVPAEQPYGIAWSGTNMWIFDFGSGLLLDLDEHYQVRTSYRAFGWDETNKAIYPISSLKYLAFDFAGNLWGNDDERVYEFRVK